MTTSLHTPLIRTAGNLHDHISATDRIVDTVVTFTRIIVFEELLKTVS